MSNDDWNKVEATILTLTTTMTVSSVFNTVVYNICGKRVCTSTLNMDFIWYKYADDVVVALSTTNTPLMSKIRFKDNVKTIISLTNNVLEKMYVEPECINKLNKMKTCSDEELAEVISVGNIETLMYAVGAISSRQGKDYEKYVAEEYIENNIVLVAARLEQIIRRLYKDIEGEYINE